MKKFLALMMVVLAVCFSFFPLSASSEEAFEIKSVTYHNNELTGELTVPQDQYFVRIVMYLEGNRYIILTDEIVDDAFCVHIMANCEYLTVSIVDRLDAFSPNPFTKFASYELFLKENN